MASIKGDPAKDPKPFVNPYKNLDLPPEAFTIGKSYLDGSTNVPRPGLNSTGREVNLILNAYPIKEFPTRNIYQYDVTILKIGKEHEQPPPRARKFAWATTLRKTTWKKMIFDGSKLAWSSNNYDQIQSIEVNLNNSQTNNDKPPGYRIIVRKAKTVNLQVLQNWLEKKGSFDERVLEALNFMDHLLREHPSTQYTPVRRAFFDPKDPLRSFDSTLDLRKGAYQAIRPAFGGKLVVNVDSVVCAFWRQVSLVSLADGFIQKYDWDKTAQAMKPRLNNPDDPSRGFSDSKAFSFISGKIRHLEVKPTFPGCTTDRTFHVFKICREDAQTFKFSWTDPATGREEDISVYDYYQRRYNLKLYSPHLPVVQMTKRDTYYPMECLQVAGLQRYNHRLSEKQTAEMIKHAVRRPVDRFADITTAKEKLAHCTDPVLDYFGLKISKEPIVTKGRLLPAPEIHFAANAKHNPQTQGRWDLRGKKFLETNRVPLKSWGIGIFKQGRNALSVNQAEEFVQLFMKQYAGHGGKIVGRPIIIEIMGDTAEAVHRLFMTTGNHFKQRPQLLLFVVPNKDALVYHRIKKSCDCRFGVASQVMQRAHVERKQPQYMSNVAMKVNAKLGGVTCKVAPSKESLNRAGCMIIGADVSHAAPGSTAASLTAISVSADQNCVKYMGSCQTGYSRVEMIDEDNMKNMLAPLVDEWTKKVGKGRRPQCVYYFRDGVSTGQFAQVLEKEVPIIKDVIHQASGEKAPPKVTVVIANKRHHIRASARLNDKVAGDKYCNPLPGTLIERDVTSPHDWDFLLVSHVALQGTAKPVHYHVIRDEMNHQPEQLQNMINNHCYQYVRSTTSVSLFPAVYYAHLISNRGRCHSADEFVDSSEESGESPQNQPSAPKPLLSMVKNENRNHLDMWFV